MQLTTMNVMLFPQVFKYWILLAVQHLHTMDFFRTMLNYISPIVTEPMVLVEYFFIIIK